MLNSENVTITIYVFVCLTTEHRLSKHEQLAYRQDRSPNMSHMMPPPGIWLWYFTTRGSILSWKACQNSNKLQLKEFVETKKLSRVFAL